MESGKDEQYMRKALKLAERGKSWTSPNPMVGAVLVKDGRLIGRGFHKKYGKNHAEVNAFASAQEEAAGSTLYVTLEPCSHQGKTPPCADIIIKNKVKRVVVAALDPNPLVSGQGIKKLQAAGIEVISGVLAEESRQLNEVFMKFITQKKPFVVMKTAMSLDGKIAARTGESKWISGEASRKRVHLERSHLSGIMVGVNTILKDNPNLTARLPGGKNPIRIVADSRLRTPVDATVLTKLEEAETIILTTRQGDPKKAEQLKKKGAEILVITEKEGRVDLTEAVEQLGERGIDSILLEGGAALNYSALAAGIVDKVQVYIAPKIIGGAESPTPVGGSGIDFLKDAFEVEKLKVQKVGEDIFLEGYISKK